MLSNIIVVLLMLLIIGSLLSGLFCLIRDEGTSERTIRAITVRISLSVLLFVLLIIGYTSGLLRPYGFGG